MLAVLMSVLLNFYYLFDMIRTNPKGSDCNYNNNFKLKCSKCQVLAKIRAAGHTKQFWEEGIGGDSNGRVVRDLKKINHLRACMLAT